MKIILIANSFARPQRVRGMSSWDGEPTMYYFDSIQTMDDAYRYQGQVLDDIVWVGLPKTVNVSEYLESRIRRFA